MKRTKKQNSRLHKLLTELNLNKEAEKSLLVLQFTDGKTGKSSEMTSKECSALIKTLENELQKLKNQNRAERQFNDTNQSLRRNVFKLMYDIGFIVNSETSAQKLDVINKWIAKRLNLDKTLNELSTEELNKLIKQLFTTRRVYKERAEHQARYN